MVTWSPVSCALRPQGAFAVVLGTSAAAPPFLQEGQEVQGAAQERGRELPPQDGQLSPAGPCQEVGGACAPCVPGATCDLLLSTPSSWALLCSQCCPTLGQLGPAPVPRPCPCPLGLAFFHRLLPSLPPRWPESLPGQLLWSSWPQQACVNGLPPHQATPRAWPGLACSRWWQNAPRLAL